MTLIFQNMTYPPLQKYSAIKQYSMQKYISQRSDFLFSKSLPS